MTDMREATLADILKERWRVESHPDKYYPDRPVGLIVSDGSLVAEICGFIDSCGNGERANSQLYASRIRAEAGRIDYLLVAAEAALAAVEPKEGADA